MMRWIVMCGGLRQISARWRSSLARVAAAALLFASLDSVLAVTLPDLEALTRTMGDRGAVREVVEPHLSTRDQAVRLRYRGWPAEQVLDRLLGTAWRQPGVEVEFRALDGYVSRVPAERFMRYRAYLVHERVGHPSFSVDNRGQNEKNVPLGPYYLIWDNVRAPELLPEGGNYWPYQVSQILVSTARTEALLPGDLAGRHGEAAALTQKHCLACHQINGYGGNKWPGNLASLAGKLSDTDFLRWVLNPSDLKPGTTMPGLPDGLPEPERQAIAKRVLDYLRAVPVKP